MDITLIILFSFIVIITIAFFMFICNTKGILENLDVEIRPLVCGDPDNLPKKDFYVIPDFHEKRKFIGNGALINLNSFAKFVVFSKSMTPMGLECGDGVYSLQFTDEQKKDIKNNNLIKTNDIIIFKYIDKKRNNRLIWKSRRSISFIDLSKSINELCLFAQEVAPEDENLNKWERVNDETILNFKNKLINKSKIIEYFNELEKYKETNEYKQQASNFILSITYKKCEKNEGKFIADYSIHHLDDLWGKVEHIIPRKYIDSREIIKECQK